MKKLLLTVPLAALVALVSGAGVAHADCPKPVTDAVAKAYPKSTVTACKAEKEHGRDQFETKVTKADGGQIELDVSPDGKILQVEEVVALDKVPGVVMKAFAAKYPKAKPTRAEKQTNDKQAVSYEIGFEVDGAKHAASFDSAGKFVEEE
jgi:hypothetical protein